MGVGAREKPCWLRRRVSKALQVEAREAGGGRTKARDHPSCLEVQAGVARAGRLAAEDKGILHFESEIVEPLKLVCISSDALQLSA